MIWQACRGTEQVKAIQGSFWRIVESHAQQATLSYVDTLEEQAILEGMLDNTKPIQPEEVHQPNIPVNMPILHYLLSSPFRYPPLPWGSRFGRVHEPSLLYGAIKIETVLAEAAFYRFVFLNSMDCDTSDAKLNTEHIAFEAQYRTNHGVQLNQAPFTKYQQELTAKNDYSSTQILGTDMRNSQIKVIQYTSARCQQQGTCLALFTPFPLFGHTSGSIQPNTQQQWLCELTANTVTYKNLSDAKLYKFSFEDFTLNGELPLPA